MKIRPLAALAVALLGASVAACSASGSSGSAASSAAAAPPTSTATTSILAKDGYYSAGPIKYTDSDGKSHAGWFYLQCRSQDVTTCASGSNWLSQATPTLPDIVTDGGEVAALVQPSHRTHLYYIQVVVPAKYQNLAALTPSQRQTVLADAAVAATRWQGAYGSGTIHHIGLPMLGVTTVISGLTASMRA